MSYAIQAGDRVFTFRIASPARLNPAWLSVVPRRSRAAAGFLLGSFAAASVMWLLLAAPGFVSDRASTAPAAVLSGS